MAWPPGGDRRKRFRDQEAGQATAGNPRGGQAKAPKPTKPTKRKTASKRRK
jgi:hypothetical protein